MASKRLYWIKLDKDFLDNLNIRRLRKIPGGEIYVIVYLKMILKTIENQGVFECAADDDFFDEFAMYLDEDKEAVKFVMKYLNKYNLAEVWANGIQIDYTRDNTGSEGMSAERMRNHRQKKNNVNILTVNSESVTLCAKNDALASQSDDKQQQQKETEKEQQQQQADEQAYDNSVVAVLEKIIEKTDIPKALKDYEALCREYGEDAAKEKLYLAAASQTNINNLGAWLRRACEGNYQKPIKTAVNAPVGSETRLKIANKSHRQPPSR